MAEIELLNLRQAADRLGYNSVRSVYNRIYAGDITAVKIRGRRLIKATEIDRFIREQLGEVDPQEDAQA